MLFKRDWEVWLLNFGVTSSFIVGWISAFSSVYLAFTSSPSFLSTEDIKFIIDEDFDLTVTSAMNLHFQTLRIEAATINYDSTIGQYGGYTINIIGVD